MNSKTGIGSRFPSQTHYYMLPVCLKIHTKGNRNPERATRSVQEPGPVLILHISSRASSLENGRKGIDHRSHAGGRINPSPFPLQKFGIKMNRRNPVNTVVSRRIIGKAFFRKVTWLWREQNENVNILKITSIQSTWHRTQTMSN